jgi:uncharacterized membrane protein
MKPSQSVVRAVWTAVIVLAIIGIAAAAHRVAVLMHPALDALFTPAAPVDATFARHPAITFIHIIPGTLFMVLGPLQFVPGIRARWVAFHRWSGRVFVASGFIIGISALVMSLGLRMAIGGANETAAITLFALVFLFDLSKAFIHIRRREIARHREWMIRAFAIGLAVAAIRPIVGAFFATSPFTHLTPRQFFGTAFWIGFTLALIAAEAWINYTRPAVAEAINSRGQIFSLCVKGHDLTGSATETTK